jgi:hypothetical protein
MTHWVDWTDVPCSYVPHGGCALPGALDDRTPSMCDEMESITINIDQPK